MRKVVFNRIPESRKEQIIAFCEDLGLVPACLVTPRIMELVYNSWLLAWHDKTIGEVLDEANAECARLYLESLVERLRGRGFRGRNRVPSPGLSDDLSSYQLRLDFDYPNIDPSTLKGRGKGRG